MVPSPSMPLLYVPYSVHSILPLPWDQGVQLHAISPYAPRPLMPTTHSSQSPLLLCMPAPFMSPHGLLPPEFPPRLLPLTPFMPCNSCLAQPRQQYSLESAAAALTSVNILKQFKMLFSIPMKTALYECGLDHRLEKKGKKRDKETYYWALPL